MRTIYIDSEFKCHVSNDGTMTAIETSFFDGKCDSFIEGYCYDTIDECCTWEHPDGTTHVHRNKQDNNQYPPLTLNVEDWWEDLGEVSLWQ